MYSVGEERDHFKSRDEMAREYEGGLGFVVAVLVAAVIVLVVLL